MYFSFSEQTPLSMDEAIVVDSSPKKVLELLEEKLGAPIQAYDLKLQIDSSMASKFGQRPVTNSHVRTITFHHRDMIRDKQEYL